VNRFNVVTKKYFNQLINGDTFAANTGVYSTRLTGNVGEQIKLEEVIEVSTIVNEGEAIEQEFIENDNTLRGPFFDYLQEGLYIGAGISIEFDGENISATIEGITNNNTDLILDSTAVTNLAATSLADCPTRNDIVIKVTDAPDSLLYKYGIIANDKTAPDYSSPLDGGEQSYQILDITGSFQTLRFTGKDQGSSLGTVQVKFDSTAETYKHKFTLTHVFYIPYYTEGEYNNIESDTNPTKYSRNNSVKYCNGFFFGGDSLNYVKFEDIGTPGNVGYFNDNFNGFENVYSVKNYAVSNASNTGKIEVTETNTITFSIETSGSAFKGGETIILYHTKLPTRSESANQKDSFSDIWLTSQVEVTDKAGTASSGVISNASVNFNAVSVELDVSLDISYTADEQDKLTDTSGLLIYATVGTENTTDAEKNNRTSLVAQVFEPTKNPDIKNLVSNWQPYIYKHSEFTSGTGYTKLNGWDGDLDGQEWSFDLDITQASYITSAKFLVVADDGTDFFTLFSQNIPFSLSQTSAHGEIYQILNVDNVNTLNIPTTEDLNRVKFSSTVPGAPSSTQTFTGSIGFRVPWRDWIANLNVPTSFFNASKPKNNLNEKTSNYSGVSGYDIKTVLQIVVKTPITGGFNLTTYDLLSDGSAVSDFDTDGGTFTAVTKYYDNTGDEITTLYTNEKVRVEIEFSHSLGTLSAANLEGLIWIESENSTVEPWYLSTELDFTNPSNPLKPSDTLAASNTQFVEIDSTLNLVKLICYVDNEFISGGNWNIYGRLDSL
jgi:hypothetical protein